MTVLRSTPADQEVAAAIIGAVFVVAVIVVIVGLWIASVRASREVKQLRERDLRSKVDRSRPGGRSP